MSATRTVESVTRQLPSNQYRFTFNGLPQIYSVRAPSVEVAYQMAHTQYAQATGYMGRVSPVYSVDVNATEWTEVTS